MIACCAEFMEEETDPKTSVRRVRSTDRKTRIEPAGSLFPVEDSTSSQPEATSEPGAELKAEAAAVTETSPDITSKPASQPVKPRSVPTKPKTQSKRGRGKPKFALLYNLVTLLFVLATVAMVVYVAYLWNNYTSPLNPFPPPTPLPIIVTTTPSP